MAGTLQAALIKRKLQRQLEQRKIVVGKVHDEKALWLTTPETIHRNRSGRARLG
jgi:hypothetical protein